MLPWFAVLMWPICMGPANENQRSNAERSAARCYQEEEVRREVNHVEVLDQESKEGS
jgi:hypothetical protein